MTPAPTPEEIHRIFADAREALAALREAIKRRIVLPELIGPRWSPPSKEFGYRQS